MKQKLKGGAEWDVFTKWRKSLCYTQRSGVCAKVKRRARRRLRHECNLELRSELLNVA